MHYCVVHVAINLGDFPVNQNFQKFLNRDKWNGNFYEKFPDKEEVVEFLKSEPSIPDIPVGNFNGYSRLEIS